MKRIALAVAVVVMAAGACKKAQNSNAGMAADTTTRMADSMKMAPGDTTHIEGAHGPRPRPCSCSREQGSGAEEAVSDATSSRRSSPGTPPGLCFYRELSLPSEPDCRVTERAMAVRVSMGGDHPSSRSMRAVE